MSWKEALGVVCSMVAIVAGLIAISDHFADDGEVSVMTSQADPPAQNVTVVLVRTVFNDSGQPYAEDFNGLIIPLNSSVQVIYA